MATTANARRQLAELLRPALGKMFDIFPVAEERDTYTKPTLLLKRSRVEPFRTPGHLVNTFELYVIEPQTNTEVSEDSLDDLLDEVLEALDESTDSLWTEAERITLGQPGNPAYRITLTLHAERKAS